MKVFISIWRDKRSGGQLYQHLRPHGKRYYNKRASSKAGRGCIPSRIYITVRPSIDETKGRIGDWEGDTIIDSQYRDVIVSYIGKHSKSTLLKKVA